MSINFRSYFTSNGNWTDKELGLGREAEGYENAYKLLYKLGKRLRKAMGEEEVLPRNLNGGEFRVPNFRDYVLACGHSLWTAYRMEEEGRYSNRVHVVSFNEDHEGFRSGKMVSGFMASAMTPYEYAVEHWKRLGKDMYPDLFDSGTIGVWMELLPQPYSLVITDNDLTLSWGEGEPRVHRSKEMSRYILTKDERNVSVKLKDGKTWRYGKALAYVMAWEKMALLEPIDRYRSKMVKEFTQLHPAHANMIVKAESND